MLYSTAVLEVAIPRKETTAQHVLQIEVRKSIVEVRKDCKNALYGKRIVFFFPQSIAIHTFCRFCFK